MESHAEAWTVARTEFFDLVRLLPEAREMLLATLETDSGDDNKRHGRRSTRHPFRGEMMPFVVMQPGGSVGAFMVLTRNLSAGGVALIHGGYLHPETKCRMMLATIQGQNVVLGGRVRRCRHIKGSLHEVGVEFNTAIVPEDFVPPEMLSATVEQMVAPEDTAEAAADAAGTPDESKATPAPEAAHEQRKAA